jgi:hypothetical protein
MARLISGKAFPSIVYDEQNAEAFMPQEMDKILDAAYKTEKPSYYMLTLIVTVTAIRIGVGLPCSLLYMSFVRVSVSHLRAKHLICSPKASKKPAALHDS